jgi:HJR/Mrr/RecB family endonuclease
VLGASGGAAVIADDIHTSHAEPLASGAAHFYASRTVLDPREREQLVAQTEVVRQVCGQLGITFQSADDYSEAALAQLTPRGVYRQELRKIEKSDVLILHCGMPSTGVGVAFEWAIAYAVPVVLLIPSDRPVSRALLSRPGLKYEVSFSEPSDLHADLTGALKLAVGINTLRQDPPSPQLSGLVQVVSTVNAQLLAHLKRHPQGMYQLTWRQFEELVAELLSSFGWEVELTTATQDGGYDLLAVSRETAPGIRTPWIIECKRYQPANRVGIDIVRALYGVKSSLPGVQALLATTSFFTRGAKEFKASRYDLHLRDYHGVVEWLRAYTPSADGTYLLREGQ